MGKPDDAAVIREEAMGRIANRPSMVLDGDPIEELARAHERHAERLESLLDGLSEVGFKNHLGETSEGIAATANMRIAVHDHAQSMTNTYRAEAANARVIAQHLRSISQAIGNTESENDADIRSAGR